MGKTINIRKVCENCDGFFEPVKVNVRFCGPYCRNSYRYWNSTKLNQQKAAIDPRNCEQCGEEYFPKTRQPSKFCGSKCGRINWGLRHPCPINGCGRPGNTKDMCKMHYLRFLRKAGRLREIPGDYYSRAKKFGVAYEKIYKEDIFDRDSWVCGICKVDVDPGVPYPDPWSPSLDHIIPMSKGGPHLPWNVRCTHLICNLEKAAS